MKSKILTIVSILALSLGFAACDDNHNYGGDDAGKGTLSFARFGVDVESTETEIESKGGADVAGFIVKIINDKNEIVEQSAYAALPEVMTLEAGDYTILVESHEVLKAEFDHPYYAGSRQISVKANSVTDAGTIVCKFASIKVTIRYAANLLPLLGDDVEVKVRANDTGELTFKKDETRSGYFQAIEGSTTLIAVLDGTINGNRVSLRKELTDVKAGHHRIITFKIKGLPENPGESGSIDPSEDINIDTDVDDVDNDGNVNVGEDNLPGDDRPGQEDPDDPTPADLFSATSETIDFDGVNRPREGVEYKVVFKSENPLTNLIVEIVSQSLNAEMLESVGLSATFDLAEPGALEDALKESFHFPVGNQVIGQTEVLFDITEFVPLLNIFPDETHTFRITLRDEKGNQQIFNLTFKS